MTLEKTGAVTAPLAAERTKLPAERRMGHQAGTGGLPQRRCHGTAVKFLGLCSGTLLTDPSVRRHGTLSAFVCSLGCWSCSAGLREQEHCAARWMGSSPFAFMGRKKDWIHSKTARSWLLSGDNHGGLGPKQAEQAALGRHLCSTDLVFSDDRREMLEHTGQREGRCYLVFCPPRGSSPLCQGGLSAGANPCWHERCYQG